MRTTTGCGSSDPLIDDSEPEPEPGQEWGSVASNQWRSEWFREARRARNDVRIQAIVDAGHTEGPAAMRLLAGRRVILLLATQYFGRPTPDCVRKLYAINDPDSVDRLIPGLAEVGSWTELLDLLEE